MPHDRFAETKKLANNILKVARLKHDCECENK